MLDNDKLGLKRVVSQVNDIGYGPWANDWRGSNTLELAEVLVNAGFTQEIFRFKKLRDVQGETQMELVQRFGAEEPGLLRGFIPSRYRLWDLYRWPV